MISKRLQLVAKGRAIRQQHAHKQSLRCLQEFERRVCHYPRNGYCRGKDRRAEFVGMEQDLDDSVQVACIPKIVESDPFVAMRKPRPRRLSHALNAFRGCQQDTAME